MKYIYQVVINDKHHSRNTVHSSLNKAIHWLVNIVLVDANLELSDIGVTKSDIKDCVKYDGFALLYTEFATFHKYAIHKKEIY